MQAATLVSLDEYLHTSYDPDCDFVEGLLEERNLGEHLHARLQTLIAIHLHSQEKSTGVRVVVEQRVQTGPARFRVPDVVVTNGHSGEPVLRHPPLLCVEILSPEDRLSKTRRRAQEYIDMGVPVVWILDPEPFRAYKCTSLGLQEVSEHELITPDGRLRLNLAALEEDLGQ